MGKINSKINDKDSDDDGESDYEHAYGFHKKVLQQGQTSGFESDNEEFCDVPCSPIEHAPEVREGSDMTYSLHCLDSSFDGGEGKGVLCPQEDALEGKNTLVQHSACSPTQGAVPKSQASEEGKSVTTVLESSDHSISTSGSGCSIKTALVHHTAVLQADPNDVYETATEGSKEDNHMGHESDEDSLSTITPPRTRPQSDSECSLDADSGSEEEASGSESQDFDTEDARSSILINGSLPRSRSDLSGLAGDRHSLGLWSSEHKDAKTLIVHCPRKRCASPSFSEDHLPAKQQKLLMSKPSSPAKVHYRYPDSDSESEDGKDHLDAARNEKEIPISVSTRNTRKLRTSLSAQTVRIAARQAASRFIRTSRRILKDAKMAARALHRYSLEKRAVKALATEKAKLSTSENSQTLRGGQADASMFLNEVMETNRKPPGLKVDDDTVKFDYHENVTEVRKNGGFGRKSTPSDAPNSSSQSAIIRSASMLSMPVDEASGYIDSQHLLRVRHPSGKTVQSVSVSTNGFQLNPSPNIHLVPLRQSSDSPHGSTDSINSELLQPLQMSACDSPFACLSSRMTEVDASLPVAFRSGSVWARVNMLNSPQADSHPGMLKGKLQPSVTSGQRMATRSRPQTPECTLEVPFPRQKTPQVPSLTLSGQFAQSGRFSFLLEDTVQVTVTTADITMTTASAIVIPTDTRLQYSSQVAKRVVAEAGPRLTHACQEFLQRQSHGLQECEVLDTPAGGNLSQLTTHVLHVVVPQKGDFGRQKKMLLCTYLNCMKHADEKLHLQSIAVPLLGAGTYPADVDLHVYFDSLLIFLAERTHSSRLHAVHLVLSNPAIARFAAEVLEARLETLMLNGVDAALQGAFQEYFGIPNFTREQCNKTTPCPGNDDRRPSGKPAIKRRRL